MKTTIYTITKNKTSILGLWQDNNKIYRDYIKEYYPINSEDFTIKIDLMFLQGEKSIFIKSKEKAFILDNNGILNELTNNFQLIREKLSFNEIKKFLNIYNGITIFKIGKLYILDIWQA